MSPTAEQIAAAHDDYTDFDEPAERTEHAVYLVHPQHGPVLLRILESNRKLAADLAERRLAWWRDRGAVAYPVTRTRQVAYTPWEVAEQ
jgi:hypothetical protein